VHGTPEEVFAKAKNIGDTTEIIPPEATAASTNKYSKNPTDVQKRLNPDTPDFRD